MKDNQIQKLISQLISIYQQQLKQYQHLLKLTETQQKEIKENKWEQLSQVINKKEDIIEDIDQLDNELKSHKMQLADKLGLKLDNQFIPKLLNQQIAGIDKLQKVISDICQIMQQINDLQKNNQNKILKERDKLQSQVNDINNGLNVNQAYSGQVNNYEGKFIDQKE